MSPRKRTPSKESKETPASVTEPPSVTATEPSATGVAEPPVAIAELPAVEDKLDGRSFAERFGQKKQVAAPDPYVIATDSAGGLRLFESKRDRQMALKFGEGRPEDKPSPAVIAKLREAGYRWNPSDRIWAHPVKGDSAMSTRIEAEWLYQEVSQMLRQEKGIKPGQEAGPEIPF